MPTQRQIKAKNAHLATVWSARAMAGSYGKQELADELEKFAKEIEGDTLIWNPQWVTEDLESIHAEEEPAEAAT